MLWCDVAETGTAVLPCDLSAGEVAMIFGCTFSHFLSQKPLPSPTLSLVTVQDSTGGDIIPAVIFSVITNTSIVITFPFQALRRVKGAVRKRPVNVLVSITWFSLTVGFRQDA